MRISPLLGMAVGLQGARHVAVRVLPLQMHLPAEVMTVRLEPMHLVLRPHSFVGAVLSLLKQECALVQDLCIRVQIGTNEAQLRRI